MAGEITWSGNTLTLARPFTGWKTELDEDNAINTSADGHRVVHHKRYVWTVEIKYDGPLTRAGEAVFWTWWAHASQGGTFTLAHDNGKDTSGLLSSGAVAAQAVVPTVTTTNYAAGDLVILEKADRSYFEVGVIQSVSAATSITLTANLKQTFATGDVVRHFDYHPSMCALTANCPLQLQSFGDTNFMQLQVKCTEVL